MNNAAILFHPDGYDTTGARLMGRHSAGESFLRGFLRHADIDNLHLFNTSGQAPAQLKPLLDRIQPTDLPMTWLDRKSRHRISEAGCLYVPQPTLAAEAWLRRPFGQSRYSICGITHTTATHRATDSLADMMTSPVERWDALICTSDAVRASVQTLLEATREDLRERLGATRFPDPELATIPLGVNAADFATTAEHRAAWRERLDIPADGIVALYLGRFHPAAKMNPATMAMALEAAAKATGKTIYWIVAGWGHNDERAAAFHADTQAFCPSIQYRAVDGRPADTRFSIWSAADFFISFSDNVQETFGLTPVEAMAAGLPSVITDWDGYRAAIRHGIDGFRIATTSARAGLGRDLAYSFAGDWIAYEGYLAAAAQLTSIDHRAAVEAISALVTDSDLRRSMGAAAARQAREQFDWSAIIPRYQALWGELAARRNAAAPDAAIAKADNPRRMDPFKLFDSYPTSVLRPDTLFRLAPDITWPVAQARLSQPLGALGAFALPSIAEAEQVFNHLAVRAEAGAADIAETFAAHRRTFVERGLLWLVKFGILELVSPPTVPQDEA